VVPENVHNSPTEGIGNSWGRVSKAKHFKGNVQSMKLNWNFQRGRGGGLRKNRFHEGWGYEYYLKPFFVFANIVFPLIVPLLC